MRRALNAETIWQGRPKKNDAHPNQANIDAANKSLSTCNNKLDTFKERVITQERICDTRANELEQARQKQREPGSHLTRHDLEMIRKN